MTSRHVRLALISIGLASVFTLLVAEAFVRLFALAPPLESEYGKNVPDTYLPYKPRPNSVTRGGYRHNSFGFRDVEHTLAKPPGVFRILGLGDSFTYGGLTPFESSYLYRLETMLNSRPGEHPKVEIIKAGISRFWPLPERLLLEHYGVGFAPDLILVGFLPNDVIDTLYGLDAVTVDKSGYLVTQDAKQLGSLGTLLYERCHLCRMFLRTYVGYRIKWKYSPDYVAVFRSNGAHEKQWQEIENEYEKMLTIAARLPARVVLINIPQKGPWTEMHSYPGQRLGAWAERHGAGLVDILPAMKRASGRGPLYLEEGHCTPRGYGVIGEEVYAYLTANHLVP